MPLNPYFMTSYLKGEANSKGSGFERGTKREDRGLIPVIPLYQVEKQCKTMI